jgi:SAM-dependent methyltransferase
MKNYLKTYYSEEKRPYTDYPFLLASYLKLNYFNSSKTILDIACGRGELLRAFNNLGMKVKGIDIDPDAKNLCAPHDVMIHDILKQKLPIKDKSIDCVFNKSIIEHLDNPEKLLIEAKRVLKKDGLIVTMCPSWVHMGWGPFYQDHTHVTPFTLPSLRDIHKLCGFEIIEIKHFRQLPLLWKFPWLVILTEIIRKLPIPYSPQNQIKYPNNLNKIVRFSNEIMLLCVAKKNSD